MTETTPLQKVQAARTAIVQAGMLLGQNAEGLAMLRMAVLQPNLSPPTVTPGRPAFMPDRGLDDAYRMAVVAAIRFASEFQALEQAEEARQPCREDRALRRAVEEFVGPKLGAMPPHASSLPADIEARYGVTPKQVERQAWRDHLAALAAGARPRLVKVKANRSPAFPAVGSFHG